MTTDLLKTNIEKNKALLAEFDKQTQWAERIALACGTSAEPIPTPRRMTTQEFMTIKKPRLTVKQFMAGFEPKEGL